MEPYSIFIPVAPKDNNKVKYLIRSIEEHLEGYTDIHLTFPNLDHKPELFKCSVPVFIHEDRKILDIDPEIFKYRPGWIYQQFVKLFQRVTGHELYLTIDSDVIINRKMPMFTKHGKRIWYMGWEQNHQPYFNFNQKMFGFGRVFPHTFINDMNFFDRRYIMEMVHSRFESVNDFITKSAEVIIGPMNDPNACYIAEPELYMNYMMKYHPSIYELIEVVSTFDGISNNDPNSVAWPDEVIEEKIAMYRNKPYDLFMLHSWCEDNVYKWSK